MVSIVNLRETGVYFFGAVVGGTIGAIAIPFFEQIATKINQYIKENWHKFTWPEMIGITFIAVNVAIITLKKCY